jgi:hypothetical protein
MKMMWSNPVIKGLIKDYYNQTILAETSIPHYDDLFHGNPDVKYGKFDEDWEFRLPDNQN